MIGSYITKIKDRFRGDNIQNRSARGALWIGGGNGIEQGTRFIRNMILTRILAPEIFGAMAIVLAVNQIFDAMTEVGVKQAIIQHPHGHEKEYLNGAFFLSMARAVLLYAIAYLFSPYVAEFYEDPTLTSLLRFAFLGVIFKGLMSPLAYVAVKEMKFRNWVIAFHGGALVGIVLAVILAIQLKSVWGLVIGFTVESFARFILSYLFFPFLPGLEINREYSKALLKFARGMIGLPILTFIFNRADVFVLGKMCTKYDLGLYSMAVTLAYIPTQLFSILVSEVALPAFSKMQHDQEKMNRTLSIITHVILYLGAPLLLYLICYGKEILGLVYGFEYGKVAIPFAIITIKALFVLCSTPLAGIYFALGEPAKHRLFAIVRAVLILALLVPMIREFGLIGAAASGLVSLLISYYLQIVQMKKLIHLYILGYLKIFVGAAVVSLVILLIHFITRNIYENHTIAQLSMGFIGFFIAIVLGILYLQRQFKLGGI